jgi:hypothetical protein
LKYSETSYFVDLLTPTHTHTLKILAVLSSFDDKYCPLPFSQSDKEYSLKFTSV